MTPARFEYFAPRSLEEAQVLLARYGDEAKVLAGGQSLLGLMKLRLATPKYVIDLGQIPGLDFIRDDGSTIAIGPLATYAQVRCSDLLRARCGLLPQTAAVVGDVQVRNRGTIGGALAHADPAADFPAAILALDGQIRASSQRGERWLPAGEFLVSFYTTALAPDEIITEVRVPVIDGCRCVYLKAARRPSDFAMVGVAAKGRIEPDGTCRDLSVALTGVADHAYRATDLERALAGGSLDPAAVAEAAAGIADGVEVNDDVHASSAYRAQLARVYAARAIQALRSEA